MVDTRHTEYEKWLKIWQRNKDCIDGQDAIKESRTTYLPKLNGQDDNAYNAYLQRAKYINFAGRTVNIGLGQIFRKNPVVENIDEEIYNDIDLSGRSLAYFSRDIMLEVVTTNRSGVLIDWSDIQQRPYLVKYNANEIINWRTERINGKNQLSLVVLEGCMEVQGKDMFEVEKEKMWRVLWLNEGVYTVSLYAENKNSVSDKFVKIEDDKIPLINGQPFNFIPFYFITSSGIKTGVTKSVMYDFCNVNPL